MVELSTEGVELSVARVKIWGGITYHRSGILHYRGAEIV